MIGIALLISLGWSVFYSIEKSFRRPRFDSRICHWPAEWSWVSHLNSLWINFLICRSEIIFYLSLWNALDLLMSSAIWGRYYFLNSQLSEGSSGLIYGIWDRLSKIQNSYLSIDSSRHWLLSLFSSGRDSLNEFLRKWDSCSCTWTTSKSLSPSRPVLKYSTGLSVTLKNECW